MANLGEAIEALRRLNQPVPRPLTLPTGLQISDAEQRSGVRFHEDLRRYLLEASDVVYGTLEPVTIQGGHTDIIAVVGNAREVGVPHDLIPICEDNGDFFCIAASGEVVYWSHDGVTEERWPDLATWVIEVWIGGS